MEEKGYRGVRKTGDKGGERDGELVVSGRRDRGERTNAQTLGDYSTR